MPNDTLAVLRAKPTIDTHLLSWLAIKQKEYSTLPWANDSFGRIRKFVVAGKTVRGCLVVYAYTLFQKTLSEEAWNTASALELIHAGLLIHDDIMDKDSIRRGMPTLHSQYEQYASSKKGAEVAHFGVSQAINNANLCYFLGYQLLTSSLTPYVSFELSRVTLSQMQDVASGHLPYVYDRDDILELYRYKTARYTFSMPLRLGAQLSGQNEKILQILESLGECFGLLFQIRDDEFDSTGDPSVTGKSVGIDTANNKQTLATLLPPEELEKIRRKLRIDAQSFIRSLPISDTQTREFLALLRFCEERSR